MEREFLNCSCPSHLAFLLKHLSYRTEAGVMSPVLPGSSTSPYRMFPIFMNMLAKVKYDWDYFCCPKNTTSHIVSQGNSTYEFVMVVSIPFLSQTSKTVN